MCGFKNLPIPRSDGGRRHAKRQRDIESERVRDRDGGGSRWRAGGDGVRLCGDQRSDLVLGLDSLERGGGEEMFLRFLYLADPKSDLDSFIGFGENFFFQISNCT